jgi:hypothetical protein
VVAFLYVGVPLFSVVDSGSHLSIQISKVPRFHVVAVLPIGASCALVWMRAQLHAEQNKSA